VVTISFIWRPQRFLCGEATKDMRKAQKEIGMPAQHSGGVPGDSGFVPGVSQHEPILILAALVTVLHRAWCALRELHIIRFTMVFVHAAIGRRRRDSSPADLRIGTECGWL